MVLFEGFQDIIENLFSIEGDVWVQRLSVSSLDLEKCNGVAKKDFTTNTCELCVALNKTIWKNANKPNYYHPNCSCKIIKTIEPKIILDFPIDKITKYLFIDESKRRMMRSFGYTIEDAMYVYNLISNVVKKNLQKININ